jgi:hypothetical protein
MVIDFLTPPRFRFSVPAHRDNAGEPSGPFSEGSLSFLTAATFLLFFFHLFQ